MNHSTVRIACLLFAIASGAQAQSIDPRGLYENTFSGGVSGREAVLIRAVPDSSNQYIISNVAGRGFTAEIQPDGQISVAPFGAVGSFNGPDSAQFSVPQNQPGQYQLQRIALTDNDFVDYNQQAFAVNPLYSGNWNGLERAFDEVTGQEIQDDNFPFSFTSTLSGNITNSGIEGLRSTEFFGGQLNGFFQGVMDSQRSWIIQVGDADFLQVDPELAVQTLDGNGTSFAVRFIGRGQFEDINTFTNTVIVENRQDNPAPPQRKLFLFQQTLQRQQPLVPGDFDGDGSVNASDRNQIMGLYGLDDFRNNYNLLADIDNNGVIDLRDTATLDNNSPQLMAIDAGHSGSWFNTSRSGEGWNLAILPGGTRATIAFFSFSPDGNDQVWIVGVGRVNGNEIIFSDLNITGGAQFGDSFDPGDVMRTTWGDIRVYFTDCNNGAISYGTDGVFSNNARPISRLTALAGAGCNQSPPVIAPSQVVTGTWFAPARDGEGIIFEALPDGRVVMYWYTYTDDDGQQYWLGGVGTFDEATNSLQFDNLRTSTGAAFGDAFASGDVMQVPWGSANFAQSDCNNGVLNFNSSLPEYGSGSYALIRLASVDNLACDPDQFTR